MAYRYQAVKVGGPFEIVKTEHPVPKAKEVLIRLKAIGLNPVDWKQLTNGHGVDSWPAVFGNEGAGVVEAVGTEVQAFKKGDEVLARFEPRESRSAAFQEFSAIAATHVAPKPESLSYEDAASIPVGYMTAGHGGGRRVERN